jgi:hypothetical protein
MATLQLTCVTAGIGSQFLYDEVIGTIWRLSMEHPEGEPNLEKAAITRLLRTMLDVFPPELKIIQLEKWVVIRQLLANLLGHRDGYEYGNPHGDTAREFECRFSEGK